MKPLALLVMYVLTTLAKRAGSGRAKAKPYSLFAGEPKPPPFELILEHTALFHKIVDAQRFQIDVSSKKGQKYRAVRIVGKDTNTSRTRTLGNTAKRDAAVAGCPRICETMHTEKSHKHRLHECQGEQR